MGKKRRFPVFSPMVSPKRKYSLSTNLLRMDTLLFDFSWLMSEFRNSFYTAPLMILCNTIFFVTALKYKRRRSKFRILIWYAGVSLLQDTLGLLPVVIDTRTFIDLDTLLLLKDAIIFAFVILEFILLFSFFYLEFPDNRTRKAVAITTVSFATLSAGIMAGLIISKSLVEERIFLGYVAVFASFITLVPTFYYFVRLFQTPPLVSLACQPSFWIVAGILFLHALNIPLFMLEDYLINFTISYFNLYAINFIAYSFLYSFFTLSVFCDRANAAT